MISYLLISLTFVLGLIGSLFDVKKKDSSGNIIRGFGGLPKLTRPGLISLIVLSISFGCTIVSTFRAKTDTDNAQLTTSRMSSDLAATRAILDATNIELSKAEQTVGQLANQDLQHFERIGSGLEQTTNKVTAQLDATSRSITKDLEKTSSDLDISVRGSSTPVNSFVLNVFFAGLPRFAPEDKALLHPNLSEIRKIACDAPGPADVTLKMSLADNPELGLSARYEKRKDFCQEHVVIETSNPIMGENTITPHFNLWPPYRYGGPCNVTGYFATFGEEETRGITVHYPISAASFRPRGRALINAIPVDKNEASLTKLQSYLSAEIPRLMGFEAAPTEGQGKILRQDLSVATAFALDSVAVIGDGVTFYFEQTVVQPQWSYWEFTGKFGFETKPIVNPYRKALRRSSIFGPHLSRSEAQSLGEQCKLM